MLQKLADKGRVDAFYTGDIADAIAAAFKKNGGLVTAADLAAYQAGGGDAAGAGVAAGTRSTPRRRPPAG